MQNEKEIKTTGDRLVSDLASAGYRAAMLFRRYGISYCCGGRWPLQAACEAQGLDVNSIAEELDKTQRVLKVPAASFAAQWSADFLIQFIEEVSHRYFKEAGHLAEVAGEFTEKHIRQYPSLQPLPATLQAWHTSMLRIVQEDEQVLFPYIRQLAHASSDKASYAAILVRTLRKPFDVRIPEQTKLLLQEVQALTPHGGEPARTCTSHKVLMHGLRELEEQVLQYLYLKNEVLYNRVIQLEKELLRNT